jgi:hypothetical protein
MVFNTTFNNISVILWQPVLVVEEAGVVFWHWELSWQIVTLRHSLISVSQLLPSQSVLQYFSYIVAVNFIGGRK